MLMVENGTKTRKKKEKRKKMMTCPFNCVVLTNQRYPLKKIQQMPHNILISRV